MNSLSDSDGASWRWLTGASLTLPVLLGIAYYAGTESSHRWLWSEQGPLEMSHVLIPLAAMAVGLATLARRERIAAIREKGLSRLAAAIFGLSLLCGVIAGEEASWGQHLWGWTTPEAWSDLNDQQETNLHNIGTWADQKPRAAVEVCVIVFGILWPLASRLTRLSVRASWQLVLPPLVVLPVALFAEGVRLLERIPEWLGTTAWAAFPRPSELQEFYFYTFFAMCVLSWRRRLLRRLARLQRPAGAQSTPDDAPIRKQAA